jgi:hypothetical protein
MNCIKGRYSCTPNNSLNIPGLITLMNLKNGRLIMGPAYAAGANKQHMDKSCDQFGRCCFANATSVSAEPWLWATNASFLNPVCCRTRPVRAGRSKSPMCRKFHCHILGSEVDRVAWRGRKPHRFEPSQTSRPDFARKKAIDDEPVQQYAPGDCKRPGMSSTGYCLGEGKSFRGGSSWALKMAGESFVLSDSGVGLTVRGLKI